MKLNLLAAGVLALTATAGMAQNINGAGATFPYPIYSKWFSEYSQAHPNVHINYQSIGSGGGIRQVSEGTVDFGATDGPMSDQQINEAKVKTMHIPTVLGAVVPVYNLPGVNAELKFSSDVIADIYLGRINKCGVISPRYDMTIKELEPWLRNLLPSRQFGYVVITSSAGIMDHEEARRKHVGGKLLGFFY